MYLLFSIYILLYMFKFMLIKMLPQQKFQNLYIHKKTLRFFQAILPKLI